MKHLAGFTLVELLASTVIFVMLLAVLFSTMGAISRANQFRNDNAAVTQAASDSFETMVRAIKSADAVVAIMAPDPSNPLNKTCQLTRGFYFEDAGGNDSLAKVAPDGSIKNLIPGDRIVTVTSEKQTDGSSKWVKHSFVYVSNGGTPPVYHLEEWTAYLDTSTDQSNYRWPLPLNTCSYHWAFNSQAQILTPVGGITISELAISLRAPMLPSIGQSGTSANSPFVSLEMVVQSTIPDRPIRQIVMHTTVVPSYSYGEVYDY